MIYHEYRLARLSELMCEPWGDLRIPGLLDLIKTANPQTVLEIGSFQGVSTEVFLLNARQVTCIDPWLDVTVRLNFQRRCAGYPHCHPIVGMSPEKIPSAHFDLCYVDADHSYDAVTKDIKACLERCSPTWIGGHDYAGVDTPDVKRAVDAAFPRIPLHLFSDSSWLVQVEKRQGQ